MSEFFEVMALSFLGSVIALSGGIIFLFSKKASRILTSYSIPFAAGVLIVVSLVGLLPEAVEMVGESAFFVVTFSFLVTYLLENYFFGIHHHEENPHGKSIEGSIPLVIVGDTLHNFIDGVTIAASYLVAPGLGLITAISTLLHEVPHEVGDFGILLKAGWRRRKILVVNLLSACATFVGSFFVLYVTDSDYLVGIFLAAAAGLFLYLGASDFLPNISEGKLTKNQSVAALVIGMIVMYITSMIIPHKALH